LLLVSTLSFRETLGLLVKKESNGYSSCIQDILNEFKDKTFDDIFNKHFLIREIGNVRVIKLRIQNSELGLSSAAGYRLIIVCNTTHKHICLLAVYPKKGKYSKIDLSQSEYRELLNLYGEQLKKKTLENFPVI
jgi:mRNA-degrading endonuclease RelE of RelBE toxin-antitoxin system